MQHPYSSTDPVEKTFITVGMIAAAVFVLAVVYSLFFLS